MKEKDTFSDRGPGHAVLIALFDGKKAGRVVIYEEFKVAIAEEYGDKEVVISDAVVRVTISNLRKSFREHAPRYKIQNRRGFGWELVNTSE